MRISKKVLNAMKNVEDRHFRTVEDTGANSCAMVVWNTLRENLGLPQITKNDLSFYCSGRYIKPKDSNLLK